MSASTVSITANTAAATRRTPILAGEKKSNFDYPQSESLANGGVGEAGGTSRDLSRGEATLDRSQGQDLGPVTRRSVSAATGTNTTATQRRTRKVATPKSEKARWKTVVRIFAKQLGALLIIVGLIQLTRKMILKASSPSSPISSYETEMAFSGLESRIAEVDGLVKATTNSMQVQVELLDKKMEREAKVLRQEIERKASAFQSELKKIESRTESLEKSVDEVNAKPWVTKDELERIYEELKKGNVDDSAFSEISIDELRAYARDIMEKEIEKHAADGLGRVDYALASGGAFVMEHSDPYLVGKGSSWFATTMRRAHTNAVKMLSPSFGEPGQCFPLKGSEGYVQIRLRGPIIPEAFTLEHVAKEIVPLNAGNVLVLGDNEPAAKWLAMINQSLNKSSSSSGGRLSPKTPSFGAGSMFFAKPSLKKISESFRTECRRKLKICNCSTFSEDIVRKYGRESCFRCPEGLVNQSGVLSDDEEDEDDDDDDEDEDEGGGKVASLVSNQMTMKYGLVASKQMVGIFLTVWMRKELIQHVSHLRISSVTRGIMGCLGNKGCIAVSLQLYKTSFCFICSHLASGEREGDERRRNLDVIEILKNTSFPRICRTSFTRVPDRITKHDRVIWLGDLNYRIALSYSETKTLLDKNAWDTLLNKDQLKIERDAGRVFKGWHEGKIFFAPTYKYSYNSDAYAGDTSKEKKNKRRTPAWCDRILWHGDGIRQLSYVRGESRFSDHRPVCSVFVVDVEVCEGKTGTRRQ